MRTRYAALAATFALLAALAATILLTSAIGPLPASAAQQTSEDSPARWPAPPFTPLRTHTLTVTAGAGGSVDPTGTTTHREGSEARLTASWNDATHTFAGWGGDCSGTATTCVLTIYANKTAMATFTPLARDRCATPTAADCIRAVYKGAPDDYAQVQDIPDSVLIQPDDDGRYQVERGQQITVVTAAPLPTGYTRFYLQRTPLRFTTRPTSFEQLLPPIGTTYTFTPIKFEGAPSQFTFGLRSGKPRPLSTPGERPQFGAVAVSTTFVISDPPSFHEVRDAPPSGNTLEPGTYRVRGTGGLPDLIITVPSNPFGIKQGNTIIGGLYIAHCFWDDEETANICIDVYDAIDFDTFTLRPSSVADPYVSLNEVFDYIAASARTEPPPAADR